MFELRQAALIANALFLLYYEAKLLCSTVTATLGAIDGAKGLGRLSLGQRIISVALFAYVMYKQTCNAAQGGMETTRVDRMNKRTGLLTRRTITLV